MSSSSFLVDHPCLVRGDIYPAINLANGAPPIDAALAVSALAANAVARTGDVAASNVATAAAFTAVAPAEPTSLTGLANLTLRRTAGLLSEVIFRGSGDVSKCTALVQRLLPRSAPPPPPPAAAGAVLDVGWIPHPQAGSPSLADRHAVEGAHHGLRRFSGPFFAASNYYFVGRQLHLLPDTLVDARPDGAQYSGSVVPAGLPYPVLSARAYAGGAVRACDQPLEDMQRMAASLKDLDPRHARLGGCFAGVWVAKLLQLEYGLDLDERRVTVTPMVDNTTVDWTLGSLLHDLHDLNLHDLKALRSEESFAGWGIGGGGGVGGGARAAAGGMPAARSARRRRLRRGGAGGGGGLGEGFVSGGHRHARRAGKKEPPHTMDNPMTSGRGARRSAGATGELAGGRLLAEVSPGRVNSSQWAEVRSSPVQSSQWASVEHLPIAMEMDPPPQSQSPHDGLHDARSSSHAACPPDVCCLPWPRGTAMSCDPLSPASGVLPLWCIVSGSWVLALALLAWFAGLRATRACGLRWYATASEREGRCTTRV